MSRIRNWNIARAKKYWLGRVLCRLAGDEKGAVMMEYVIVAVLIAAACVVAVAMFGKTIVGMFDVAAKGATGDAAGAKTDIETVKSGQNTNAKTASDYHDGMHTGGTDAGGVGGQGGGQGGSAQGGGTK